MAKYKERLIARGMRKNGDSIGYIAKQLGVSKSTVSLWCYDIELSEDQISELLKKAHKFSELGRAVAAKNKKEERLIREHKFAKLGKIDIGKLSRRELLLIGTALYWAEGSKRRGRVVMVNSDPMMARLFIRWLSVCYEIDSTCLTCRVAINEAHSYRMKEIEKYWSCILNIPLAQFTSTTLIHSRARKLYENMNTYFGVITISVRRSTNLNYQICGGIELLRQIDVLMVQ